MDDSARSAIQKKSFQRWVNHYLGERMLKIEDLYTGFEDGLNLIALLEIISNKDLSKQTAGGRKLAVNRTIKPGAMGQRQIGENLMSCLEFLKAEGLKIVNIKGEDLISSEDGSRTGGKHQLVLGLVWLIILRYQINLGDGSPKAALLEWVNNQIRPYSPGVPQVKDFTNSWTSGSALAALTDSLKRGLIDCKNLNDPINDIQNAINLAEQNFDIPPLVDAVDMANNPDEMSMMTYISCFRDYLENKATKDALYNEHGPRPENCFATGKGVEGGFARRPLPFVIHARNKNNEPANHPKAKGTFNVQVKGPSGLVPCEVTDNGDGTYSGLYTAPTAGKHTVDIDLSGPNGGQGPIKCSTYRLDVAEPSDPKRSYAEGEGLTRAFDDVPGKFTVYCIDRNGKTVPNEDTLKVKIDLKSRAAKSAAPAAASGAAAPQYKIPKFCEECGAVLTGSKFCEECGAKVVPVAVGGAPAATAAKGAPHQESENVLVEILNNGDGSYGVTYKATIAGNYDVNVTIDDALIKDMPSALTVYKGADPLQTYATGRGVSSPGFVGRQHPFVIHTVDRDGNPLTTGGNKFDIKVAGPTGPLPIKLVDNNDGTYSGSYKPDAIGNHRVEIKLIKGDASPHIKDSPFNIGVKQGADPLKSYAEGEGTKFATDNRPGLFKVFAFDKDGRPVTGEWVDVKIKDPKTGADAGFPIDIKDNNDGTYDVRYDADTPGQFKLDVTIDDKSIRDMPTSITIYPGVDPSKTIVEGPGVSEGMLGKELPFLVRAMDKHGNPMQCGGDSFKPTVLDPHGNELPCKIVDNGDGTYSGSYTPLETGDHTVSLLANDMPDKVGNSPYTCHVRPAGDGSKSYAKGKGWRYAYDNQPTGFVVHVNDENGKPVVGERLKISMNKDPSNEKQSLFSKLLCQVDDYVLKKKQENTRKLVAERRAQRAAEGKQADQQDSDVPCDITDNGDGTYTVDYVASDAGAYLIEVLVGSGQHIQESVKKIMVEWTCPNVPCRHTNDELREAKEALEEEVRQLKARLTALGQKV